MAALLLAPLFAHAGVIHVDASANGANNGSSWVNAYTDLQEALATAVNGDEIWVAAGLYKPTDGSDRTATFQLVSGVKIYGGFAGNEIQRDQRDWHTNVTVLSGDIDDNDATHPHGVVVDADDIVGSNSFHVVTGSDTDTTAILDGFVITAGLANGTAVSPCGPMCGGGMVNISGSPTLANLRFSGNRADNRGGGMYNFSSSSPTLTNVSFSGNHTERGGGMANYDDSSPSLTYVSFSGNRATIIGGGMYNGAQTSPTLTNVNFIGNNGGHGGGMANSESNPTLTNVSFSGNSADYRGGGMANFSHNSPSLTNVTFSGNRALELAGGMYNANNSHPVIRNTIFWNNRDSFGIGTAGASIYNVLSSPQISFSLVQGCNENGQWWDWNNDNSRCGIDQGNNLPDADPLFMNTPDHDTAPTTVGNLRLSVDSPALDAGNNAVVTATADLVGNTRIANSIVDLGPYERPASDCPTGGVIHVDRHAAEPGDGQAWASAYRDLQDALLVEGLCELWVAAGVYKPVEPADANGVTEAERQATFQLINGVALYGGFAGTEIERNQRNLHTNVTVLSGDIDNNDTANAHGVVVDAGDIVGNNSFQVVTGSGTDATAILDGFVITAGLANGTAVAPCGPACGGGMYNVKGSPTLANITFSGNRAAGGGGMFNVDESSPTLTQVRFNGNTAADDGGGMYNFDHSNPTLTHVSFSHNSADRWGGGIFNRDDSSPTLTQVSFSGNLATQVGGGMHNWNSSSPILTNVSFSGNDAAEAGGMYSRASNPTLTNVSFSGNSADNRGGGMHNRASNPTLTNVSFSGNSAGTNGGGMHNWDSSHPVIHNSIFWHNRDNSGTGTAAASISNADSSTPQISYSLVQGQNPAGGGNLDGTNPANNPLFINTPDPAAAPTTAGNLRLSADSPALDAGNNAVVTATTDLAGNARIVNTTVDLGPYERPSSACPTGGMIHVDRQAAAPGDGTSWASAYRDLQDALLIAGSCEIWVAAGVYKPTNDPNHRAATFQLNNGVEIYGGFAGTENQRDQRDWQANITVLSGDIDNNDITDANGVVLDVGGIVGSNSFHVVTSSDTDGTAIMDGFVITAGLANGISADPCDRQCGGGMYNLVGSPALTNVRFSGNRAGTNGGGMYNNGSNPTLTNVSFSGNRAGAGGGMSNNGSNPTLTNVRFNGNRAGCGGGMFNEVSSPTLTNGNFSGNVGIWNGGMCNTDSSYPVIRNTVFWNNGAGLNVGTAAAAIFNNDFGTLPVPEISYSLVQGCNPGGNWNTSPSTCGTDGGNNLPDADPLFINTPDPADAPTSQGNLRLRAGSPAIDAGNDAYFDDIDNATDLDGNPRKVGEAVDLGPFEYLPNLLFHDRFEEVTP